MLKSNFVVSAVKFVDSLGVLEMEKGDFNDIKNIFANRVQKKPPAYQWQDLALRIIKEINPPPFKKSSVFKICKEKPKELVEKALIDTRELCKTGERWKYFFKIIAESK